MASLFLLVLPVFFPAMSIAQAETYTNLIGMEFVRIRPGSMIVGKFQPPYPKPPQSGSDPELQWTPQDYKLAEEMAGKDAGNGFKVNIEHSYFIGKYEVTQAQWKRVMGNNPSVFQDSKVTADASQHPVENVSWEDVQQFLKKLNQMDKSRIYRLPTEFEWEYAARAGAQDDISWNDIQAMAQLGTVTTGKAGQKKPNAWGLYDMLGNVWEWVQDYYNEKIFADPVPPRSGKKHVLKGASFMGDVKNATYFTHAAGPGNGWDVGFRIVMEIK